MTPSLTRDALDALAAPFEPDQIRVKVQSTNRDKTRAMLVQYIQHTAVADRLEQVDPSWSSEIKECKEIGDAHNGFRCYVLLKLTVLGVSRENMGEGDDPKSAASDALKRAAMSFGVGRGFYDESRVWTSYDHERDRFRQWTLDDYETARGEAGEPVEEPGSGLTRGRRGADQGSRATGRSGSASYRSSGGSGRRPAKRNPWEGPSRLRAGVRGGKPPVTPLPQGGEGRGGLLDEVEHHRNALELSETDLRNWAINSFGVPEDEMSVRQLQQFLGELERETRRVGAS